MTCERLLDITNGQVFLSGVTVDSAAVYRCNTGFELVGDSSRTCQSSGLWSGAEPSCTRELQNLDNVYILEYIRTCNTNSLINRTSTSVNVSSSVRQLLVVIVWTTLRTVVLNSPALKLAQWPPTRAPLVSSSLVPSLVTVYPLGSGLAQLQSAKVRTRGLL